MVDQKLLQTGTNFLCIAVTTPIPEFADDQGGEEQHFHPVFRLKT
jgi:hypothetical protein